MHVTSATNIIIKNAKEIIRIIAVDKVGAIAINCNISRIDEVEVISVTPSVIVCKPTGTRLLQVSWIVSLISKKQELILAINKAKGGLL